jgi:NAD(P)-dependent dehydrogenase (short-subunit alcohol dehydrogenase family)
VSARLQGRVAIVTGGASGIGLASAQRMAAEGARVVLCDLQTELGEAAAAAIRATGGEAGFFRCNVASEAEVEACVEAARSAFGLADILVNSAFKTHIVDFLTLKSEELQLEFDINVKGPFFFGQRVARELVRLGRPGAIVNITSVAAEQSSGNQVAYSTTKSGLAGLTRAMAIALAPSNIRVNAVAPGPTLTPAGEKVLNLPAVKEAMLSRVPLGRYAEASEQAAAVAFLASDDASFITGETLFVDGGRMVLNHTMNVQNAALLKPGSP